MTITETIAEVLRLDAQATQGPWDYWFEVGTRLGPDREHPIALVKQMRRASCPGGVRGAGVDADAALIAYYRTAAPALAREVQRLQAEVERLRPRPSFCVQCLYDLAGSDCCPECGAEVQDSSDGYQDAYRAGQEAMRERAAEVCGTRHQEHWSRVLVAHNGYAHDRAEGMADEADECADAIRALEVTHD